jgi:hypothetical protein
MKLRPRARDPSFIVTIKIEVEGILSFVTIFI